MRNIWRERVNVPNTAVLPVAGPTINDVRSGSGDAVATRQSPSTTVPAPATLAPELRTVLPSTVKVAPVSTLTVADRYGTPVTVTAPETCRRWPPSIRVAVAPSIVVVPDSTTNTFGVIYWNGIPDRESCRMTRLWRFTPWRSMTWPIS